ncbi:TetR/AcrR family transcriptional regulator [Streptomyces sp. NBC_00988]|uniref:TetR/AcrR family transcriptional regulator n=1 Tax=Streptomyces sp. NBC_00988 TaxID=2903704 RepID=UPI0038675DB3|nr:TetR/AcrR family transcriptional regulator [Streptomyces sp. NBC_00988]
MTATETSGRPSEARERLLATATGIFYASGIHSVGVERLVAEAKVTRATFYRHFPSKEDLVAAYLQRINQHIRDQHERAVSGGKPAADILREIGRQIVADIRSPGFRGCAFLNAAAEYPDADHPVHQLVLAHREWFLAAITSLFARTHDSPPEGSGRHFVMMRDGAMAAGYLGDPIVTGETFLNSIEGLLQVRAVDGVRFLLPTETQR